jgi:hypothetical protein
MAMQRITRPRRFQRLQQSCARTPGLPKEPTGLVADLKEATKRSTKKASSRSRSRSRK